MTSSHTDARPLHGPPFADFGAPKIVEATPGCSIGDLRQKIQRRVGRLP
jgi:hypothetical protein